MRIHFPYCALHNQGLNGSHNSYSLTRMSTWERERKKNNTKRSGLRTSKLQRHIFLYLTQEKIAVVLTPTLHRQHKYLMECENFYPCTRCAASLISVVIIASRLLLLLFFFFYALRKNPRGRKRRSREEILTDDEIDYCENNSDIFNQINARYLAK